MFSKKIYKYLFIGGIILILIYIILLLIGNPLLF
jgi:hypothetical protein